MSPGAAAWARACRAIDLLACNPEGLRGTVVRARCGPVRDTYLETLTARLPKPVRRIHPAMPRDALLGGLDLSRTLADGHLVRTKGLLDEPGTLILAMAERCPPDIAAILAAALDSNPGLTLVVLDEGAEPDETAPKALSERLAFHVYLEGIGRLEAKPPARARSFPKKLPPSRPRSWRNPSPEVTKLTALASRLGIDSLRAPNLAVQAAKTLALQHHRLPNEEDIQSAAELVLAPRATRLPEPEEQEETQEPETPPSPPSDNEQRLPDDILIDAVRAALPADILENLSVRDIFRATGTGAGQKRKGNRRGRPLPSRPGRLDGSARLDLVATLRTAAPWQTIRNRGDGPVRVLPSDIRLRRYEEKSDRLVIFAVDASGSAALTRLGEAKGAVELMLARAYAARDHVALIAFRGEAAELLLPPTRSLVQTKRRLAALPGGGGTPLAAGLQAAAELALQSRGRGLSPTLAVLTDGRANIALDGSANRAQAADDSTQMARFIRVVGLPAIVLDLGTRPQPQLSALASSMAGRYMALPRADAARMSDALTKVMDDGLGT